MTELEEALKNKVRADIEVNPSYKMYMAQDNYISEHAMSYVLYALSYYAKHIGKPTIDTINMLFGMSERKAEFTAEIIEDMNLVEMYDKAHAEEINESGDKNDQLLR